MLKRVLSCIGLAASLAISICSQVWAAPSVVDVSTLQCEVTDNAPRCDDKIQFDMGYEQELREGRCRYRSLEGLPVGDRWFDRCVDGFIGAYAQVCLVGQMGRLGCGAINHSGEIVIPLVYDHIEITPHSAIVAVNYNGKWGFFNLDEDRLLLAPQFSRITSFSEGLAYVETESEDITEPGWIINEQGLRVASVPRKIQVAGRFSDGLAPARSDTLWGYINNKGEWAISPQFYYAGEFSSGYATVLAIDKPQQWAIIDVSGAGALFFEGDQHRVGEVVGAAVAVTFDCESEPAVATSVRCKRMCLELNNPEPKAACTKVIETR
ncbi:WG repeat-containing protein [Hahella sp. HN01]|uniref:WG repeat-containing protein n=1 Tax=Hahella sp. HN01 TaxID=2847262 RepID=UPI001C1EF6A3|nr:WG repeat-containing protein [Hahella sp. HN01]MBU6949765.1 WG repeat-containing protein [Hahella sp. HN01]